MVGAVASNPGRRLHSSAPGESSPTRRIPPSGSAAIPGCRRQWALGVSAFVIGNLPSESGQCLRGEWLQKDQLRKEHGLRKKQALKNEPLTLIVMTDELSGWPKAQWIVRGLA